MKNIQRLLVLSTISTLLSTFALANSATAVLKNAKGEEVGQATLVEVKDGVKIRVRFSKLEAGVHGVHIHEKGLCEGPDFKTAGGHFNPTAKEHGTENPKGHHAGDLPNVKASVTGKGVLEFIDHNVTLKEGTNSLLKEGATSIVVHAKEDDEKTNPSGNSGDRIACGVIAKK